MGTFLDKPKTEKHNETGSGNGLRYGLSSMQGWRVEMEDAHTAIIGLPHGLTDWSFFAVFDGHAGAKASAYCAEKLLDSITNNDDFKNSSNGGTSPNLEAVKKGIKMGFLHLDDQMRRMPEMVNGEDKSGSTAVGVMVSPSQVFFVNCGDSRAIISSGGQVSFSTQDHKPINPEEKERIQNAGGTVMIQRVNGSLAVSRALGDFEYKNVQGKGPCEQLVSPEPEIYALDRTPQDEFIVLACDGIWDVMKNEEICDYVRYRLQLEDNLEKICNSVVDTCLYKGSRDNMSIVIISMENAPKVNEEAKLREEELDKRLEEKIKDLIHKADYSEFIRIGSIMQSLAIEDIEGLPPGGGLYAKQSTVESIVTKLTGDAPRP